MTKRLTLSLPTSNLPFEVPDFYVSHGEEQKVAALKPLKTHSTVKRVVFLVVAAFVVVSFLGSQQRKNQTQTPAAAQ